jgi:catechol 2,3-dioxygenase-like lactoylglutathione lyase family enzyme
VRTKVDHVAFAVADLDERIRFLREVFGFTLRRLGTQVSTGSRIAFLGHPDSPLKVELVESAQQRGFLHLALRVDDVHAEFERLTRAGLKPIRPPIRLAAAKADSALLEDAEGWTIQIVRYDADSPDL